MKMAVINIKKEQENKLVYLELNFPQKKNILSLEVIQSLTEHLTALGQDPHIHLLILSGKGSDFCAGGDLRWMRLPEEQSDLENVNQVKLLSKMFYSLFHFPTPVIGKIQGAVFGGGLGLTALCDIAVAHKDSRFCFSELKLALVPALITPFVMKKMPPSQIRELMLSARVFNAETAQKLGLIHWLGSAVECESYIHKLVSQLLNFDKVALRQTKKILNILPELSESSARDYTVQSLAERRKSSSARKKIDRFLRSRKLKK